MIQQITIVRKDVETSLLIRPIRPVRLLNGQVSFQHRKILLGIPTIMVTAEDDGLNQHLLEQLQLGQGMPTSLLPNASAKEAVTTIGRGEPISDGPTLVDHTSAITARTHSPPLIPIHESIGEFEGIDGEKVGLAPNSRKTRENLRIDLQKELSSSHIHSKTPLEERGRETETN
jgi:hypothetical protein